MKIKDLDGREIEVTDLDLAFLQADDYRHYHHADSAFTRLDEKQHAYWQDMYDKLEQLKLKLDKHENID